MKRTLIIFAALSSFSVGAESSHRSMVQVGSSGFGATGAYEKFEPKGSSLFDEFSIVKGNFALNYSYAVMPQLQIGLFFSNRHDERKFKTTDGKSGRIEEETQQIGLQALWNFKRDLHDSTYAGVMLSHLNHEDENDHVEPFDYLEDDRSAQSVDLIVGKRFGLERWGIHNITYSPSLSVFITNSQKDYEDDGIDKSYGIVVNLIKFDVLF
jgi:hypothetical protein